MSKLGVELHDQFAFFRVWAPFARSVAIQGEFSDWAEIPLAKSDQFEDDGVWVTRIADVRPGQSYNYSIIGHHGQKLVRNDPRAKVLTDSDNGMSVVADETFDWGSDKDFQPAPIENQVLYELHIGTFARPDAATIATFADAIGKLDHLKDLGITTVELMPITSMSASFGWGYAPNAVYSVEGVYGGMFGLKNFVKEAHDRGIAVVLDLVYNHFLGGSAGLWQFDGWTKGKRGGIYFYNDDRGDTPWGGRPDYGRAEVRSFILDNVAMWLNDYHIDGMRLDSTIYMRNVNGKNNDPAGDISDAWQLLGDATDLAHKINPAALMIAEDCAGNDWITKPRSDAGCGFDTQWDLGLPHVIRGALDIAGEPSGLGHLNDVMSQQFNGDWRQRIVFADSHDTAANGGARIVSVAAKDPHNVDARRIAILSSAIALTTPGVPMLLAGSEFLQSGDFNDWQALNWDNLEQFSGIVTAHRHLIALRRNQYGDTTGLTSGEINVLGADEGAKVLTYKRGNDNDHPVIVVASFNSNKLPDYVLPLPEGEWKVRFNSSWKGYSSDFVELRMHKIVAGRSITLPPYGVLILTKIS